MSIFKKGEKDNKKKEEKKKKEIKEEKEPKKEAEKPLRGKKEIKKDIKKTELPTAFGEESISVGESFSDVLISPHITEKPTVLAEINQYVFKVRQKANKIEIKKAVEKIYNVKVESVKIIKVPRKKRRVGRTTGWRKGYKKAIVKISKNQRIELLPR